MKKIGIYEALRFAERYAEHQKNRPQVKVLEQKIVVNGYDFDLDMVSKVAIVSIQGERAFLRVHVEEIDKLKQALDVVKNMLGEAHENG